MFIYKKELGNHIEEHIKRALLVLSRCFRCNHKELYLVGGCVRDLLLGKTPKDYDLCTNATPDEVKILTLNNFYTVIDTGLKHGTVTIHDKEEDVFFEITTYRIDGEYEDSRHPNKVTFTPNLEEDMKRRDFTINSFAYNIETDEVLMLDEKFIYDLEFGLIRAVGNPNLRFQEDALRMMRAIRFAAQLNFTIETETWNAISANASLILNISKERIRDELTKIICSNHPEKVSLLSYTSNEPGTSLAHYVLPVLDDMMQCGQHNKWHYLDVAHHTFEVMKNVRPTPIMRWAALLHDCGKPFSKTIDEDGWEHFYGHPKVSAEIAENYLVNLKFDCYSRDSIVTLVKYHDVDIRPNMSKAKCRRNLQKFITNEKDLVKEYLELHRADAFAHKLNSPMQTMEELSFAITLYEDMLTENQPMLIKNLKVNGNDLKAEGLVGKEIGDMLHYLLEQVVDNPELNNYNDLIKLVREKKNG